MRVHNTAVNFFRITFRTMLLFVPPLTILKLSFEARIPPYAPATNLDTWTDFTTSSHTIRRTFYIAAL